MKKLLLLSVCLISFYITSGQSDKDQITETLLHYIEGTANGAPERIKKAFHKDLNLYSISNDTLSIRSGKKYISYFKEGKKRERVGKIVSIDVVNDAAIAKVEIDVPTRKRLYTDYMMLLKVKGTWKIIHKSYTHINY
ncbi:nuclear transport factor 2 family protein [Aquimarina sp. AD1]|uniref:nuclear transport factor 2 family protein n=1 Tax=Aquimarina sp. (strain AD1) TaxID=1714848 RepID=UPI000E4D99EE|nr:nuclear transport factor 2 family protein [Aquimarina sp. AD1]AXT55236.1 nuclear transport factor 2 family protein [Aquimarina sp. AD1]RKN07483.1 nuclear transport factor 2 family protein [Aquimarina sp. AD1]